MGNLKRYSIFLLLCATALCAKAQHCSVSCARCDSCDRPQKQVKTDANVSSSTLIIWYKNGGKNKSRLMKAVRKYKAELLYDYRNFNGIAIKIPKGTDINKAIGYFKKVKGVVSVSRDHIMQLDNDTAQ